MQYNEKQFGTIHLSGQLFKMYQFHLTLFRLFGMLPFKVAKNKVLFSKFLFVWSLLITSIFVYISVKRCVAYSNWNFEVSENYIYFILLKYEALWVLTEISLATIPLYFKHNRLHKYIENLLSLSQLSSLKVVNKKMVVVTIITLIEWIILFEGSYLLYYPTRKNTEDFVDLIVSPVQSVCRSIHLLHLFVALNIMVEHLKYIEGEVSFRSPNLKKIFFEYNKVLKTYKQFRRVYQVFLTFTILEIFYDVMSCLKRVEDFFIHHCLAEKNSSLELFTIFWYLIHTPLLLFIFHEGQLFNQKVLDVSKRLNKLHRNKGHPRSLSMLYFISFSKCYDWIFNHKTILWLISQIGAYHVITMQFSDVLKK